MFLEEFNDIIAPIIGTELSIFDELSYSTDIALSNHSYVTIRVIDGHIRSVWYYEQSSTWHRLDGPAHIEYDIVNGKHRKILERWFVNDLMHRDGGPAEVHYSYEGSSIRKRNVYYWQGGRVTKADYNVLYGEYVAQQSLEAINDSAMAL